MINRRHFLATAVAIPAAAQSKPPKKAAPAKPARSGPLPISVFSKPFHWASIPDMAAMCRDLGFDGVELAVRDEKGCISSNRVAVDLPEAVATMKKAGLTVPMIATDITDASFPHTSEMLKTASQLGIKYFRWKGFEYDYTKPLEPQLKNLRPAVAELAAMAKEYGINGLYHAHSGEKKVGANFFDLWYLLDGIDPKALAWNLDTGHVTAEGGRGAWRNSIGILENRIRGLAVKDFVWEKDSKGKWDTRWCELGKGMVRLPEILELVAKTGFDGPVSMHFEQPELGKAKEGTSENDIPRDRFLAIFQRDLPVFRSMMKTAGLG